MNLQMVNQGHTRQCQKGQQFLAQLNPNCVKVVPLILENTATSFPKHHLELLQFLCTVSDGMPKHGRLPKFKGKPSSQHIQYDLDNGAGWSRDLQPDYIVIYSLDGDYRWRLIPMLVRFCQLDTNLRHIWS